MPSLPLWFVSERKERTPTLDAPCDDREAMLAFTTTEKLSDFLSASKAGEWRINLASDRESLVLVIAIAHNRHIESICIDPENDGSGGQQISLNDLMVLAQSLR